MERRPREKATDEAFDSEMASWLTVSDILVVMLYRKPLSSFLFSIQPNSDWIEIGMGFFFPKYRILCGAGNV